jgi:hypothetical protein
LRKSKETTIITQRKEAKVIRTWKGHNFLFFQVTNQTVEVFTDKTCAAAAKNHVHKKTQLMT